VSGPTSEEAAARPPPGGAHEIGIARGTFLGVRADIVAAISAAAVSITVSRALGPEKRGIFFLAFAAATLISIAGNFGLNTAALVYAANKEIPLGQVHGVALVFSGLLGVIAAVVLIPFEGFWTDSVLKGLDTTMLAMLAAGVPALIYTQVGGAALVGLGRIPALSWIRIGVQVGTAVLVIPVAIVTQEPEWTLAAWLILAVGYALAVGAYMFLRASPPAWPGRKTVRELISFSSRGYLGTISQQGLLRVDVFFLGARSGPSKVGLYSLATVLAEQIGLVGTALYAASASRIGSFDRDAAARLTVQLCRVLFLGIAPTAVALGLLSIPGIPLVFGDNFSPAIVPFVLLLPGVVAFNLWSPVNLFIVSNLRRPGTTTIITSCALLLGLPLYYFMIRWLGMTGAAIASSILYCLVLTGGIYVLTRATSVGLGDLLPRRSDAADMLAAARAAIQSIRR
jgi:O-antigen/teichoic acid export membrane protein